MKSKNKKGFTLVELLAVIVILAVVILIAVTAVIPRMNKARENAFVDEALVYMKAAKEAYISNESDECYNIADMGDLVKQNKSGYTGTVYVNEKGTSINLTNGKYYIKTDTQPNAYDLVTTKPDKFIDACSDTNKTYTISYDLGGGTVSTANPTSYNQNTPTFTLNNPTKSGYRFAGWTTKNIFDVTTWMNYIYSVNKGKINKLDKKFVLTSTGSDCYTNTYVGETGYPIPVKTDTDYIISWKPNPSNVSGKTFVFKQDSTHVSINNRTATNLSFHTITDKDFIKIRFGVQDEGNTVMYSDIQIEEGTTATDYQEFMEPTITAKVYRGSTGNKKFIANWEAI